MQQFYFFFLKNDANGERDGPPAVTFSFFDAVRAPGSLHLQRSVFGTFANTCST
jgi:hypothetical protein